MTAANPSKNHSSIARRKSATRRYANLDDSGEIKFTVRVHGLNHWYGEDDSRAQVLHDIELDLYPGEVTVLTGPSGSGKTTLLTLMGGLRSVQEGSVTVLGRELRGLRAGELVKV
ncbi:MAG: ATP-binding cassette domain-containing protein, partial [Pirellulales bacterium]